MLYLKNIKSELVFTLLEPYNVVGLEIQNRTIFDNFIFLSYSYITHICFRDKDVLGYVTLSGIKN
jgi:hypothetical protein